MFAGGPRAGKTTIAEKLGELHGVRVRTSLELEQHPDILALPKEERWSAASAMAARWMEEPGPWLLEGVQAPRALRKWLARNPIGTPAECVIWLGAPITERSRGQHVMAAGCLTVWKEIRPVLDRRGVRIIEFT